MEHLHATEGRTPFLAYRSAVIREGDLPRVGSHVTDDLPRPDGEKDCGLTNNLETNSTQKNKNECFMCNPLENVS